VKAAFCEKAITEDLL